MAMSVSHIKKLGRGLSVCLLTAAAPAMANPAGGQVAAGSARIQYGQTTVITQTTNRSVVNWQSFSINANEATRLNLPNSKSVILNRVVGGNASQIMGKLTSNGQVFLVNPNGIVFGKTAQVDVAGLVASTANITNKDFMQGNYHFTQAPVGSSVINEGNITVRGAGLAALVAPNVVNRGVIQAQLGRVALASGAAFTVDLYGDNLITFDASSTVKGSVDNIGRIEANGGTVMLSVAAAEGIVENVVNTSGYISARSVSSKNGKIILQGGSGSVANVSGTLDVSGEETGQSGGTIHVYADNTHLQSGAVLNARGNTQGGLIETSAKQTVTIDDGVSVQASAYQGQAGLWLIDPTNLTVDNTAATAYNASLQAGTNVSINADNNITFTNAGVPITWGTSAVFDVIADFDHNGVGTISFTSGTVATSAGTINFYYNPTSYATPTNFSSNVSVSGSGTFNPYMLVNTAANLNAIAADASLWTTGHYYALGTNIDMSGTANFAMIGNVTTPFSGVFSGNGYAIQNLSLTKTGTTDVGLFGYVNKINVADPNPVIRNITLTNLTITNPSTTTATSVNTGGVIGLMQSGILAGAFSVSGSISSLGQISTGRQSNNVGGIAGQISGVTFASDFTAVNNASITGTSALGGIFGLFSGTLGSTNTLTNNGNVSYDNTAISSSLIAGIIGSFSANSTLSNNITNTGTISGNTSSASATGGIFSSITNGTSVSGTLLNTGTVQNGRLIGGIIGLLQGTGTYSGSWSNTGIINGSLSVGGVIGQFSAPITTVLSAALNNTGGDVTGSAGDDGGLIGLFSGGTVSGNLTSNANVTGFSNAGGLIGRIDGGASTSTVSLISTVFVGPDATKTISISGPGGGNGGNPSPGGGLFGMISNAGTIVANLTNNATVSGNHQESGGLIGYLTNTTIIGTLVNNGNVFTRGGGGIVGTLDVGGVLNAAGTTITNNGTVTNNVSRNANYGTGGILGELTGGTIIANSIINNGTVTNTSSQTAFDFGGIIGFMTSGTINAPAITNTGVINALAATTGGIIGRLSGGTFLGTPTLLNTNTVTGFNNTGGMIGLLDNYDASGLVFSFVGGTKTVSGSGTNVGGIVGLMQGNSALLPIALPNDIVLTGTGTNVGGFIGQMSGGTVSGQVLSHVGNVTGRTSIGGVIGTLSGYTLFAPIALSASAGTIQATTSYAGGIFGTLTNISFTNAMNTTGSLVVQSANGAGGLIGLMSGTAALTGSNAMSNSATFGASTNLGGIVGVVSTTNSNPLTNTNLSTVAISNTNTNTSVGSVIGQLLNTTYDGTNILSPLNTVSVSNSTNVGSFVGRVTNSTITGSLSNTSSIYTVIGSNSVGGLIGIADTGSILSGNFTNYANVTGTTSVGGIIGTLTNSTMNGTNIFGDGTSPTGSKNTLILNSTGSRLGGIMGLMSGTSTVSGTNTVSANVSYSAGTSTSIIGGIIGRVSGTPTFSGTLNNIAFTVDNSTIVGGYFGQLFETDGAVINGLTNAVSVQAAGTVGGIIGNILSDIGGTHLITFSNLTNTGSVTGSSTTLATNLGGIVGGIQNTSSSILIFQGTSLLSNSGNVISAATSGTNALGGIIGSTNNTGGGSTITLTNAMVNSGNISMSGTPISGVNSLGGIIGSTASATTISLGSGVAWTNNANITLPNTFIQMGGVIGSFTGTYNSTAGSATSGLFNNGTLTGSVTSTLSLGGIIGFTSSGTLNGLLQNNSTGTISGPMNIGGVIGNLAATTVSSTASLINTAAISSTNGSTSIGGIIGLQSNGSISAGASLSNLGAVTGVGSATTGVGGIVGTLTGGTISATLVNQAAATVQGVNSIGGVIGLVASGGNLAGGSFTNNALITSTAAGTNIGGVIGKYTDRNATLSTDLINNGVVDGTNTSAGVGGITGVIGGAGALGLILTGNLINNANIIGTTNVGGLFGTIANVYFLQDNAHVIQNNGGIITGTTNVGGLIGLFSTGTSFTPASATSTGATTVQGTSNVGGLIGLMQGTSNSSTALFAPTNTTSILGTTISGTSNVGGVVGSLGNFATFSPLADVSTNASTLVTGTSSNVGGIIGQVQNNPNTFFTPGSTITLTNAATVKFTGAGLKSGLGGIFGNYAKAGSTINANLTNNGTIGDSTFTANASDGTGGISGNITGTVNAIITINGVLTNNGNVYGITDTGGLFGSTTYTTFSSISLLSSGIATITGNGGNNVGGLIGRMSSGTTLSSNNISINGALTVVGGNNVGGVIGTMLGTGTGTNLAIFSPVTGSTSTVNGALVSGINNVGGYIGLLSNFATFAPQDNLSTGSATTVTASGNYAGGIIGLVENNANTTFNPLSTITITNAASVKFTGAGTHNGLGGIFGSYAKTNTTIAGNLTNTGTIGDSTFTTNAADGTGGIIGNLAGTSGNVITVTGTLTNSGNIYGTTQTGGLFGITTFATFSGSNGLLNTGGTIQGSSNVGGLIGEMGNATTFTRTGSIQNTGGNVIGTGSGTVGGLFGVIDSTITSFAPTGTLTNAASVTLNASGGGSNVGGIFGSILKTGMTLAMNMSNSGNVTLNGSTSGTYQDVGGIMGLLDGSQTLTFTGTLSNAGSIAITAANGTDTYIGGLFGRMTSGAVLGTVGGLGTFSNSGLVDTTASSAHAQSGGIIGLVSGGTLYGTYSNSGNVGTAGNSTNVGGILGNLGAATLSGNLQLTGGQITGQTNVGGLIGKTNTGSQITTTTTLSANATGTSILVRGNTHVGGLIGSISTDNTTFRPTSATTTVGSGGTFTVTTTGSNPSAIGGIIGYIASATTVAPAVFNPGTMSNAATVSGANAQYVGGIIGNSAYGAGAFDTVGLTFGGALSNTGSITGNNSVGGIFGGFLAPNTATVTFNALTNTGTVNTTLSSATFVGGIGGQLIAPSGVAKTAIFNGAISNTSNISGNNNIGGLFGALNNATFNVSLTSSVSVTGTAASGIGTFKLGGLIGSATNTDFKQSLSHDTGNVSGAGIANTNGGIGGLIGYTLNSIYENALSSSSGNVSGETFVGGLLGYVDSNNVFTNTSSLSLTQNSAGSRTITSNGASGDAVGGLIGYLSDHGTVLQATSLSTSVSNGGSIAVLGHESIGGLIGIIDNQGGFTTSSPGTMTNNADVTGSMYVGGLIGKQTSTTFTTSNALVQSSGTLTATTGVLGGVVGEMTAGSLQLNLVTVGTNTTYQGTATVGGVIGAITGGTLSGTFNTQPLTINNASSVGAIIGQAYNYTFTQNITNATSLSGNSSMMGGIAGLMSGTTSINAGVTLTNTGNLTNTATDSLVGGIVGGAFDLNLTTGAFVNTGNVIGNRYIGGIVGEASNSTFDLSMSAGTGTLGFNTTGTDLGGIVGFMTGTNAINLSKITLNSPLFDVAGSTNIGGVVGYAEGNPTFTGTLNTNAITINDASQVGVIMGEAHDAVLTTFTNQTNLLGNSTIVGGIAGIFTGTTDIAHGDTVTNQGNIVGSSIVGGVVGQLDTITLQAGSVMLNNGDVSGEQYVGGVIGNMLDSAVANQLTFQSGTLAFTGGARSNMGGIIGYMSGNSSLDLSGLSLLSPSFSTSTNDTNIGGAIGYLDGSATFSNSFAQTPLTIDQGTFIGAIIGEAHDATFLTSVVNDTDISSAQGVSLGGVIGHMTGNTTIDSGKVLQNTAQITGTTTVGGVIGQTDGIALSTGSLSSTGDVSGEHNVGGLIGEMVDTTLSNALSYDIGTLTLNNSGSGLGAVVGYMTGASSIDLGSIFVGDTVTFDVTGGSDVAAVAGLVDGTPTFTNTLAIAGLTIDDASHVGIVIGHLQNVSNFSSNISNFVSLSGTSDTVGGIFGYVDNSTLTGTYNNSATIAGSTIVGGIMGGAYNGTNLTGTFTNNGNVDPVDTVGGIAGEIDNAVLSGTFEFNNGTVTGGTNVGGLFGYITNSSTISSTASLSTASNASVVGDDNVGGLIGYLDASTQYLATNTFINMADVSTATGTANIAGIFGTVGTGLSIGNNLTNQGYVHSTTADALAGILASPDGVTFTGTLSNTGSINGHNNVGGLFGAFDSAATVSDISGATLISTGTVSSDDSGQNIGGIIGQLSNATLLPTSIVSNAIVSTHASNTGGVIGLSTVDINTNMTMGGLNGGSVQGQQSTGGIIGYVAGGTLSGSFTLLSNVSGDFNLGGIVGTLGGGSLTGNFTLGDGSAQQYYLNLTHGDSTLGGVVGYMLGSSTLNLDNITLHTNAILNTFNSSNIGGAVGLVTDDGSANTPTLSGTFATNPITITGSNFAVGAIIGGVQNASNFNASITNNTQLIANSSTHVGGVIGSVDGPNTVLNGSLTNTANVAGYNDIGGVIGFVGNHSTLGSTLSLASTGGLISGPSNVGGIIGHLGTDVTYLMTTTLTNNASVTANQNAGGIFGYVDGGLNGITIANDLLNTGTITSIGGQSGGITPFITSDITFSGTVENQGNVNGTNVVGGLFASFSHGTLSGTFLTSGGTITANGSYVGGLIGQLDSGAIVNALSMSTSTTHGATTVRGNNFVGGLFGGVNNNIGSFQVAAPLDNAATVIGNAGSYGVGGIIGQALFTLHTDMLNTGSVSGTFGTAGIVGVLDGATLDGALTNRGNIVGNTALGGIAGFIQNNASLAGILTVGSSGGSAITLTGDAGGIAMGYIAGVLQLGGDIASTSVTVHDNVSFSDGAGFIGVGGIVGGLSTGGHLTGFGSGYAIDHDIVALNTTGVGSVIGVISNVDLLDNLSALTNVTGGSGVGGVVGLAALLSGPTPGNSIQGTLTNNGYSVTGTTGVGGIIGIANNVTISGILASSNAAVTGTSDIGGLIGSAADSTLSGDFNVGTSGLVSLTLNNTGTGLGGIIGHMTGTTNLTGSGTVNQLSISATGASDIGTVVGIMEDNTALTGLHNITLPGTLSVANASTVGGVIGKMANLTHFTQTISSAINVDASTSNTVGGIVGAIENSAITSTFSSSGHITGNNTVGGVVGAIINSTITSPDQSAGHHVSSFSATGTITGVNTVGGVAGSMSNSTMSQAYFNGTVSGQNAIGGIVGSMDANSTLALSYNNSVHTVIGLSSGANAIGGIAGVNAGTISNVIFGGAITAASGNYAGGIAGLNTGSILSSLSAGYFNTSSGAILGAIVGNNSGFLGVNNTTDLAPFFSRTTFATGYGGKNMSATGTGSVGGSQAGTYLNLNQASTFAPYNWNFTTAWQQLPGYYVTNQWCTTQCGIHNTAPIPPTPPAPPVPINNPNYNRQYITVEQILNNADLTNMEQDYLVFGDTFSIYSVPMMGYFIPFKVMIFHRDPTSPMFAATSAEKALATGTTPHTHEQPKQAVSMHLLFADNSR